MEKRPMKNLSNNLLKSLFKNRLLIFILPLLLATLLGCGLTLRKDLDLKKGTPTTEQISNTSNQEDSFGANSKYTSDYSQEAEGGVSPGDEPEPPPKVGLILGPGGVKSFAHTGVIRELVKAQIPIDLIVGMEWGAIIGAFFANNGQIHDTEWKLYKLQRKNLTKKKSFFLDKNSPISVHDLKKFLDTGLGNTNFNQTKIDFACPSLSLQSGVIQWQNRGSLKRGIERCWPYPPMFEPKGNWVAAPFALAESIAYLKDRGVELIIFINVMGLGNLLDTEPLKTDYKSSIIWQEMRRHLNHTKDLGIEVIQVKTKMFKLYDLDHRKSLVLAGERAGKLAVQKLLHKYEF